jgi:uncharacterized protein YndB with AHSA1/START domain
MSKTEFVKNNRTKITAEPGKQELRVIREFDAPRELVFKAHTHPDLYIHWLGPRKIKMKLEKFEPTNGSSWRYVHRDEDGNEYMHFMECITKLLAQRGLSARLRLKVYQNLNM